MTPYGRRGEDVRLVLDTWRRPPPTPAGALGASPGAWGEPEIALEKSRDRPGFLALLGELIVLLRERGDAELEKAFRAWVAQVMLPRRFRGVPAESLPRLEEVRTMLEETVREWTAGWVAEGRAEGLEQGRAEGLEQGRAEEREQGRAAERALLCRQAARKFDAATAQRLSAALAEVGDADRLAEVGDWIIECGTAAELLDRVARHGS